MWHPDKNRQMTSKERHQAWEDSRQKALPGPPGKTWMNNSSAAVNLCVEECNFEFLCNRNIFHISNNFSSESHFLFFKKKKMQEAQETRWTTPHTQDMVILRVIFSLNFDQINFDSLNKFWKRYQKQKCKLHESW